MAATTQYNDQRATTVKNPYCNAFIAGATIKKAYGTITIAKSTEADSLAVLADKISSDSIVHSIKRTNTAAGSDCLADNDIVIRKSKDLAKPKSDEVLLADGFSLAAVGTSVETLGVNVSSFDKTKSLKEHLEMGDDAIGDYLALCLKMNDAAGSSVATTFDYEIEYSSPQ